MTDGSRIGTLLKSGLKKKSLSMRKLSALSGIETATISRIINNKQQAKLSHLQLFATHLDLPLHELIQAAGYDVSESTDTSLSDIQNSLNIIENILGTSHMLDQQFTTERVKQELIKYEQYAQTSEGHQIICEDFHAKVSQVNGAGPFIEQLKQMHVQYYDENTSPIERAVIGSALLYFILSIDIIPDYVFPIGYVDDALAVQLVLERLEHMNDPV